MLEQYWPEISAFLQVLFIDIVLAGDNAVVVGMAAAGVPAEIRSKVILAGITGAVVLRIIFAVIATQLLGIIGLTLAGGVLLLWVCWKMYREIVAGNEGADADDGVDDVGEGAFLDGTSRVHRPQKSFGQAIVQILVADLSMSLDNVLAVAGAAQDHMTVLIFGLLLSVALMGAAASLIAGLLARHRWIAWIGLTVILYVAVEMIWKGSGQVACSGLAPGWCNASLGDWFGGAKAGH